MHSFLFCLKQKYSGTLMLSPCWVNAKVTERPQLLQTKGTVCSPSPCLSTTYFSVMQMFIFSLHRWHSNWYQNDSGRKSCLREAFWDFTWMSCIAHQRRESCNFPSAVSEWVLSPLSLPSKVYRGVFFLIMPCSCSLWVYREFSHLSLSILYCGVSPKYYWAVIFLELFTVPPRSLSRIDLKDWFDFLSGYFPMHLTIQSQLTLLFTQSIPWNTSVNFTVNFFLFKYFLINSLFWLTFHPFSQKTKYMGQDILWHRFLGNFPGTTLHLDNLTFYCCLLLLNN